jgi:HEAT repeat protein
MHHPIRTHPSISRPLGLALCSLLALVAGCATTTSNSEIDPAEDETYRPLGPASRRDDSIGKYLGDLSTSINAWMEKTLYASTQQERNKQVLLETNIRERVRNRYDEILGQLETGPERNRIIAAGALGFSNQPAVVSPLLVALEDPNPKVVGNALMSLGVLGAPETPLNEIGQLLRYSPNPKTRWSAADCAVSLIAVGADRQGIVKPARAGLTDAEEPMVRTLSALILALVGDTESIDALGNLLYDEVPLVSKSGAEALGYLGKKNEKYEGQAARALFRAMSEGDRDLQLRVLPSLKQVSGGRDYGLDIEEWERWVRKLP